MKTIFLNLSLKAKIFIFSSLSFIVAILSYYFFYVSLEMSSGQFCKTHYCLALIPTEGYIAIVLGVISLIAVVISLDSWKIGQKYNDEFNRYKIAIDQAINLKNKLISFNINQLFIVNEIGYIKLLGELSETEKEFKYFKVNIDELNDNKTSSFEYFFKSLNDSKVKNSPEMKAATSNLISSLHACIEILEKNYENFKLK